MKAEFFHNCSKLCLVFRSVQKYYAICTYSRRAFPWKGGQPSSPQGENTFFYIHVECSVFKGKNVAFFSWNCYAIVEVNSIMKSTEKQGPKSRPLIPRYMWIILVVGVAAYSDAALVFSDSLTAAGTVAYIFTLVAFLLDLYICFRCSALDKPPLSRLLGRSLVTLAWIYCLVQAAMGVLFTFVLTAAPVLLVTALCVIWFLLALVVLHPAR